MEIILESTGIKVKGNCVIKELQPLQKIMLETIDSERSSFQIDLSEVENFTHSDCLASSKLVYK